MKLKNDSFTGLIDPRTGSTDSAVALTSIKTTTMIKLTTVLILFFASPSGISGDYDKTREEINAAIAAGNYTEVKSLLTQLMPEMKDDLKQDKALYNETKKTAEKEVVMSIKNKMDRKKEIYESLDHLLNVSPAAVRARAGSIVRLLDEYTKLELALS